jgi:uncharacterized protein YjgD (DUF1641 family)
MEPERLSSFRRRAFATRRAQGLKSMAYAIDFIPPERNTKEPLYAQLKDAPGQHVEALLEIYAIIQLLHDKGILDLIKGALGSGEKVLGVVTETMENDEVIRILRNFVLLLKLVGSFEPEAMEGVLKAVTRHVQNSKTKKPDGIVQIIRKFSSEDSRRALESLAIATESWGQQIKKSDSKPAARKRISRHSA